MTLVIDASVAVKWFLPEEGHYGAKDLAKGDLRLIAPDLLIAELANVLRRKVRFGDMTAAQGLEAVTRVTMPLSELVSSQKLIATGFTISSSMNHSVYDTMYLACALADPTAILDGKFAAKAAGAGYGEKVLTLADAVARFATGQGKEHG